jgi:hypothetical protein
VGGSLSNCARGQLVFFSTISGEVCGFQDADGPLRLVAQFLPQGD